MCYFSLTLLSDRSNFFLLKVEKISIKRKTDGKGKLYVTFYPELYGVEDKFYHVKVREQISSSQVGVYFHFYVYPETHEILHFTPRTGQAITLSEFREMLQERANKGKKE